MSNSRENSGQNGGPRWRVSVLSEVAFSRGAIETIDELFRHDRREPKWFAVPTECLDNYWLQRTEIVVRRRAALDAPDAPGVPKPTVTSATIESDTETAVGTLL